MTEKLENFFMLTDAMEEALYEIDPNLSPVEWIIQKLRVVTRIDQGCRTGDEAYEAAVNERYKDTYPTYDDKALVILKEILEMPIVQKAGGWLPIDIFGKEASEDAWLIAQHADIDFMIKVRDLIKPFYDSGRVGVTDYVLLNDRVESSLGRDQICGTQWGKDKDGVLRPWPCKGGTTELVEQAAADIGYPTFGGPLNLKKQFNERNWNHPLGVENLEFGFMPHYFKKPDENKNNGLDLKPL